MHAGKAPLLSSPQLERVAVQWSWPPASSPQKPDTSPSLPLSCIEAVRRPAWMMATTHGRKCSLVISSGKAANPQRGTSSCEGASVHPAQTVSAAWSDPEAIVWRGDVSLPPKERRDCLGDPNATFTNGEVQIGRSFGERRPSDLTVCGHVRFAGAWILLLCCAAARPN